MTGSKNKIIKDARVLSADYLPNKMIHREGERQEIARNLQPLLEDRNPRDMLLYGQPGTGKTAMAKYVVEELKKETFVESRYINCFSQKSTFEVFYELLDEKLTTPRDGTSTRKVIDKFEEKTRRKPTIIIIDEVDQLKEDETLYELQRFKNVGIIFIANDSNVFAHFEERIRSRLTGISKIHFKRYTQDQLKDILQLRRKHGLTQDTVTDKHLDKIASKAGGDARVAINTLRYAAQEAEQQNNSQITGEIIEESIDQSFEEDRLDSLDKLNKHQKKVYQILQEEGEMSMGDLFDKYQTQIDEPRSKRTLRRYLNKMKAYNVIKVKGEKRGKTYQLAN